VRAIDDGARRQTVLHALADHVDRLVQLDDTEVRALMDSEIGHLQMFDHAQPVDALYRLGGYVAALLIRDMERRAT
jgi:hypothetical protein